MEIDKHKKHAKLIKILNKAHKDEKLNIFYKIIIIK
jgi:hypothetical protein